MHIVRVHARADARQNAVAHRFACGLAAHAVKIVEKIEQNRRRASDFLIPQRPILIHRRHADAFPDRAAAH